MNIEQEIQNILDRNFTRGDNAKALKELLVLFNANRRFDFDKLLQDYRQEFVNGGGYSRSDRFENGTEPYEVFEWFKKKLS